MTHDSSNRDRLRALAARAMRERGLDPDFPPAVTAEVARMDGPPETADKVRDLRTLLWCSIDNDDSRDLDQLSVAEEGENGAVRVLVAIADVDAAVTSGSACDGHARLNTTSVYTPAAVFPMLPERLSTDLTSLNDHEDRLAIVVEMLVARDGSVGSSDVYRATVRNHAKLAYNSVGDWLEGRGALPPAAAAAPGVDRQLELQDRAAEALYNARRRAGALEFESTDVRHVFSDGHLVDVAPERPNRAKSLIQNFMIAANTVVAAFLERHGFPLLRRVVRSPERWDRIRNIAAETGESLPDTPDSAALARFLERRRAADPARFVDLSTAVIKLIGSGEYVVDPPGTEPPGHFGLAVRNYSHSTAPNRRYPDLITQRLLKAVLAGRRAPYSVDDLGRLAAHCTKQEDAANKVERQVRKSATALLVQSRVGQVFDAIVTGASPKGTYVRVVSPPMEGRVMRGEEGLDVGDAVRVRLDHVDVDRGFIDFSANGRRSR